MVGVKRVVGLVWYSASLCWTSAGAGEHHAGVARMEVTAAAGSADALVWYPTSAPEVAWQAGPFTVSANRDAPVAAGHFPVVLLSHGRQGGPLSHRALAAHLARAGFVVVAPTHAGDAAGQPPAPNPREVLRQRPPQVQAALAAVQEDPRFAGHLDTARLSLIGYSSGGDTALVLAGATPDGALADRYCAGVGAADVGSCAAVRERGDGAVPAPAPAAAPRLPPVQAVVLLDPLALRFDAAGLANVTAPVLLYRPADDAEMAAAPNALALARDLPQAPQTEVVPGRHFVFIDPCPPALMDEAALVCRDAPGVDRVAIHDAMARAITRFLQSPTGVQRGAGAGAPLPPLVSPGPGPTQNE